MEALLITTWLEGRDALPVIDVASVSLVRDEVRAVAAVVGLSAEATTAMATAASELAHNQLAHGRDGVVAVAAIERDGVAGVEVIAADLGNGIASPSRALASRAPSTGLGVGFAGVRSLSDELDVDVRIGEGTCVRARKFVASVRRRREVGIFGRAHPEERTCGDHAAFVRTARALVVAVVDGLGHGPAARAASSAAVARFLQRADRSPVDVLDACHDAIKGTRGAVMSVVAIDEPAGTLAASSAGNVGVRAFGPGGERRFGGVAFVLGTAGRAPSFRVDRARLDDRDALVVFTDGLSARTVTDGRSDLLREHPVVVAETLVKESARDDDDVLVLVAR